MPNKEKAWLSAFEYLFVLGGHIPYVEDRVLVSGEGIWRTFYVCTFLPTCLIDVFQVADEGYVNLSILKYKTETTDAFNALLRWFSQVVEAFETETTPPSDLPHGYEFWSKSAELSESQMLWFQEQMNQINLSSLGSDNTSTENQRDGDFLRAKIRRCDQSTLTVDIWDNHKCDDDLYRYFFCTYQLAC